MIKGEKKGIECTEKEDTTLVCGVMLFCTRISLAVGYWVIPKFSVPVVRFDRKKGSNYL